MDLCAEMMLARLREEHAPRMSSTKICPPFRHRLGNLPLVKGRGSAFNADRLLNRFWDYPRHLRRRVHEFDVFHLCDHSYGQLVHEVPAQRSGVLCHDLDTFRCLLEPQFEPRPRWFRSMVRRTLDGLQKAALVFYVSDLTRRQIEKYGLIDPARLVHAPNGVAPEFSPDPGEQEADRPPVTALLDFPFLLHVGSSIPRKRIDVLLDVFAGVRERNPDLLLVQVGGNWTGDQRTRIERLGLAPSLLQLRGLDRTALAALYRRATLVLLPSEAEGFGLPVIEALACGSVVLASDIPVLREVGGGAAVYCPVADIPAWVEAACRLLERPEAAPARAVRLAHSRRYSWSAQAETIVTAYENLLIRA
jgi:glycosyltransferase involved in cell wall biosynthesis